MAHRNPMVSRCRLEFATSLGVRFTPYTYDGPRQPNGDFLENLKITENLRFCDFSDPAEIYGKFTEKLPKTTEIKQQIRNTYKIRRFPYGRIRNKSVRVLTAWGPPLAKVRISEASRYPKTRVPIGVPLACRRRPTVPKDS